MSEKISVPGTTKKKFQMVTTSHTVAGGALRDDPSVTIHPSGRAVANRGGTDTMDQVAGTADETYLVKFGVDLETQTIGVFMGAANEKGLMRIRRYHGKGGSRISFHMGGVWKEYPDLQPQSKGDYLVYFETDAEGVPYMEINLQSVLTRRKGNGTEPATETGKTAASEN